MNVQLGERVVLFGTPGVCIVFDPYVRDAHDAHIGMIGAMNFASGMRPGPVYFYPKRQKLSVNQLKKPGDWCSIEDTFK